MIDYASNFSTHEIVDRVETPTLRSYLLQGRRNGRRVGEFWCRVSVFDRFVSVVGDFDPIVFAYGPTDLRALIAWMGSHPTVDGYVAQKAAMGSGGRDKISQWDVDQARVELRERIAELQRDADEVCEDEGEQSSEYIERSREIERLRSVASRSPEYDGHLGCALLGVAVYEALSCPDDPEWIGALGREIGSHVHLAHAAVARLHTLLSVEENA